MSSRSRKYLSGSQKRKIPEKKNQEINKLTMYFSTLLIHYLPTRSNENENKILEDHVTVLTKLDDQDQNCNELLIWLYYQGMKFQVSWASSH